MNGGKETYENILSITSELPPDKLVYFATLLGQRSLKRTLHKDNKHLNRTESEIASNIDNKLAELLEDSNNKPKPEHGNKLEDFILNQDNKIQDGQEVSTPFLLTMSTCVTASNIISSRTTEKLQYLLELELDYSEWLHDKKKDHTLELIDNTNDHKKRLFNYPETTKNLGEILEITNHIKTSNLQSARSVIQNIT
jgi:hypothetical protein